MSSGRECAIEIELAPEDIAASEHRMASEQVRTTVILRHVEVSG